MVYITKLLEQFFLNPFFKVKKIIIVIIKINLKSIRLKFDPRNRSKIKEFRNVIKELRNFAKEQILKRVEEIKNVGIVRDDILSFILKSQGSVFFFFLN